MPRRTQAERSAATREALIEATLGLLVERGWAGIECLGGIPGKVGAAPMQNVGAYGQEVAQSLRAVCVVDLDTLAPMSLHHELGDAWRSWCNLGGVLLDMGVLEEVEQTVQRALGEAAIVLVLE